MNILNTIKTYWNNAKGCKSYQLNLRGPAEQKLEPKHICAGKSEGISHCFAKGPRPH